MNIAVICSPDSWYLQDLKRAAAGRHEVFQVPFTRLASSVGIGGVGVRSVDHPLNNADAVLVRTMPPGSLEQVVFRMDALAQLESRGVAVLNPARAVEAAVDKYLATARLQSAGLLVPETHVCQTAQQAMVALEQLGGRAVLKPIFGGEGRGVTLLEDEAVALRAFKLLEGLGSVVYLQQFIQHEGSDLRLLVIGQQVLGMRRTNPSDWRTNISRGATGEPLEVTDELAEIAQRAAASVGATLAGVDLLPGRDGRLYALEVNAVPGWRALSRVTGRDVAAEVLAWLTKLRKKTQ